MLAETRPTIRDRALDALAARLRLGSHARVADVTDAAPPPIAQPWDAWIDADGLVRLADGGYRRAFLNAAPAWAILGGVNPPPLYPALPGYRALERHGVLEAGGVRRFFILQKRP